MQSVLIPWLSAARQTKAGGLCLKRKIRIHDSEDEDAVEFEYQQRGPLHIHLPPNHPAADSAVLSMPPELLSNSDVSDDEEEDDSQPGLIEQSDADAVDLLGPFADITAAREADVAATIGVAPGIDPQSTIPPPTTKCQPLKLTLSQQLQMTKLSTWQRQVLTP